MSVSSPQPAFRFDVLRMSEADLPAAHELSRAVAWPHRLEDWQFVLSVGELSASLLVLPPGVTTISVRIFQLLHYGVDDRVAALALSVFAAMAAIAMAIATRSTLRTNK